MNRFRVPILVALFSGMGIAHLLANPHQHQVHDLLFKGTYVQIILAALWYGWKGGLWMSGATSALYLFHILFQLRGHGPHSTPTLLTELLLYNVVALVTGVLTERQVRSGRALAAASRDLESSYHSLQEKTRELILAEEQLRVTDRLRIAGELAASMAHEVRNPLGGVLGAAEILAREGTSPETRREFAEVLVREIRRLDHVIGDYLEYARPREGEVVDADPAIVISGTLRLVEPTLRRKSIRVVRRESEGSMAMRADPEQVTQILLNLILNALAVMPDQGTLTLSVEARGKDLALAVEDSGPGIPGEVAGRIFEPFVSGRAGGTGLGLSISLRIAEGLGGRLLLARTGPQGTCFELLLPRSPGATG